MQPTARITCASRWARFSWRPTQACGLGTFSALRGSCWATKTTKLGQPWACTLFGLTGRGAQSSWVIKWLQSLSEAVTQSISEPFSLPEPDFIMPVFACIDDKTHPKFSGPLPHTQALSLLRWAVQVPWEPRTSACLNSDEAHAYTLHSLKVALLSASAQLRLPEESRRQQGHHRINSVQLYSRDDTIESLWVQAQIAAALIRGWRPTRPQSREASIQSSSRYSALMHSPSQRA